MTAEDATGAVRTRYLSLQATQPQSMDEDDFLLSLNSSLVTAAACIRAGVPLSALRIAVLDHSSEKQIGTVSAGRASETADLVHGRAAITIRLAPPSGDSDISFANVISLVTEMIRNRHYPSVAKADDQGIFVRLAIYPRDA